MAIRFPAALTNNKKPKNTRVAQNRSDNNNKKIIEKATIPPRPHGTLYLRSCGHRNGTANVRVD